MNVEILIELIRIIPEVVIIFAIFIVFLVLRKPLIERILPSLNEFKGFGLEFKLIEEKMELAEKVKVGNGSEEYNKDVIHRVEKHIDKIRKKRVLWIDDNVSWIKYDVDVFRSVGFEVDISIDTETAMDKLRLFKYDIVITDMKRSKNSIAGLEVSKRVKLEKLNVPVIIYVGKLDQSRGVPPYTFGITDRLDELLNLCIDLCDR